MSTTTQQGIKYIPPGEGERLWVLGDQVTLKTDGENDGLTMFVATIMPGGGPPPHVHKEQEEAHFVLEGTFSFLSGDTWIEAPAGSLIFIPRRTVHTFRNVRTTTGRLVSTNNFPGSHERWFRHIGVPMPDPVMFEPPKDPPDMEDVMSSAAHEDINFMAPNGNGGMQQ